MTKLDHLSRRAFLRLAGAGVGTLALAPLLEACSQAVPATPQASPLAAATQAPAALPSGGALAVDLTAAPARVDLLPGGATRVWSYQGQVTQGEPGSLQAIPDSYLGPILRLRSGQDVRLHFTNQIPDPTIVHWHGLSMPDTMDGHPRFSIPAGQAYDYQFRVLNRAGTYWYHPHPMGFTGAQAYYGLAGMLIVSDDEEAALGLPAGEFDLPLVIQDRSFDAQNQWVYAADTMNGFFGDLVLVNGQAQRTWQVQARPYRLRLLNGSNARIYKLGWQDETPLTVIATDGGLLEKPVQRSYLMLAPGERAELWVDFSAYAAGQELLLGSLPYDLPAGGMGGMMMGSSGPPNGTPLDILRFQVQPALGSGFPSLPERLSAPGFHSEQEAVNQADPRQFTLSMAMMTGVINGRSYNLSEVAADEMVRLGDLEVWEFYNAEGAGGGMGMGMMGGAHPHPMHVHGGQFQVIGRQVDRANEQTYQSIRAGLVDEGWKDTVLVWPGERVRLLIKFENYPGLYLYHCHNLEHEDGGMMRNYRIQE